MTRNLSTFTLLVAATLALSGVAAAQSYPGDYELTGSIDSRARTRATLTIRASAGRLLLERVTTQPSSDRWTAEAALPAPGSALRVIYRLNRGSGITGALTASRPLPQSLFIATYRFEQGQLRERVVNFTRGRAGQRWARTETTQRRALPPQILALRNRIVAIASANTNERDTIPAVRAQLQPLIDELGRYYAANRPVDEPALTRGAWKSLWYDDPDIESSERFGPLDRENIYQVIFDGYYYNVSNARLSVFGLKLFTNHSYLKGNYSIADPASAATLGQPRRNVIDLEFAGNRLRVGKIPNDRPLVELVDRVESRKRTTIPIPGPRGVTGELWNVYLDEDVRISLGVQDDNGVRDVYILRRTERAGPLGPLR
jgi:PAP fibrillin